MKYFLFTSFIVLGLSILPFIRSPKYIEISKTGIDGDTASLISVTENLSKNQQAELPTSTKSNIASTTLASTIEQKTPSVRSSLSSKELSQGDVLIISIYDKALVPETATFDGEAISFFPYSGHIITLIPIPIQKKEGTYVFSAKFKNGETMDRAVNVKARNFPTIVLGIPTEVGVTSNELITELQTKKVGLNEIMGVKAPEIFFESSFIPPISGSLKLSSVFGEIRKTGENEIRHLGIDLAAPLGTPVYAMNGGVVRDAYIDTIYGNSIILDHGQGIFSLYMHLNSMNVKKGDTVKRGDVVGAVGKTGYATAEHLHLSLKINGVSVDPLRFIESFK